MRVLAMDAALGLCSVALLQGGRCLGQRRGADSRSVTVTLPGLVRELLDEHGSALDAVAVTVGPGSFTGLRGALALAHGVALGAGAAVVGVTVAEALLAAAPPPSGRAAWVALDSRRAGRLFLGRGEAMEATSLASLPMPEQKVIVYGDAAAAVVDALRERGCDAVAAGADCVSAVAVGQVAMRRLAGELAPCAAQPLYVEPPEARAVAPLRPPPA